MSNDKQQSAVEWIFDHMVGLAEDYDDGKINYTQYCNGVKEILEQAKEMEKERMLECYLKADVSPRKYEFEQWYNETYGGNK